MVNYGNGKSIEKVIVPDGIKKISFWSFSGNSIKEIKLPESVVIIDGCVSSSPNLKTIYIGKDVRYISNIAFAYAPNGITININRSENAISGAPWGATGATVNWIGTD